MDDPRDSVRVCRTCSGEFPLTIEFFHADTRYRGGFRSHCKACISAKLTPYKAALRRARGAKPNRRPRLVDGVECWECKTPGCGWHPRGEFYDSVAGDWPRPFCKPCHNRTSLENQQSNEARQRIARRKQERQRRVDPERWAAKRRRLEERNRLAALGLRHCPGPCGQDLPFAEFHPTDKSPTGSRARCRECRNKQAAQYARKRRQHDPERARGYVHARKARIRGAEVCNLTNDEWLAIRRAYGDQCAFCGIVCHDRPEITPDKLTKEHDIPVSRGGWHSASNVFPACLSCNASKRDYTAAEFEARTGRRLDRGPHPLLQLRFDVHMPRKNRKARSV